MNLALFDFDGTISDRDSFLLFLKYADPFAFYLSCAVLLPRILLFLVKRYPNRNLKEDFLTRMLKGRTEAELQKLSEHFCGEKIPAIIRPGASRRIRWHQQQGDEICIVTATPRLMLEPWCRAHDLKILGTELAADSAGRLSGKLAGENCRGEEKVRRIRAAFPVNDYAAIHCYGDTSGDEPMLRLAPEATRFYRPFRGRDNPEETPRFSG